MLSTKNAATVSSFLRDVDVEVDLDAGCLPT